MNWGIPVQFVMLFVAQIAICNFASAQALTANAGPNQSICMNDTSAIGGNPAATGGTAPYTYDWQPTTGLDSPTASNPNCFPAAPTNYTLTVTDGSGNSSKDVIAISLAPIPTVLAGPDQTITAGTTANLLASGAVDYSWYPFDELANPNTATPIAEPAATTTFCVAGADANGCVNFDCMVLEVIPSDTVIIYNAFTPNGDGDNDFLYIGNIKAFPDNKLEIFNRNGKLVYQASQYKNDWNGKIEGTELPCATYYMVLSLGPGFGKKQAAITIIR